MTVAKAAGTTNAVETAANAAVKRAMKDKPLRCGKAVIEYSS
jgi:hypothetical protein